MQSTTDRPEAGSPAGAAERWRIEDLATRVELSVDTIRFYQTGGLLPLPARAGRKAVYDESHLERLRLIRSMAAKGLSLKAIRLLLERDRGDDGNTDTALMLAMVHVLASENLHDRAFIERYCDGWAMFEAYMTGRADGVPKTPEWAAPICGLPAAQIAGLAVPAVGPGQRELGRNAGVGARPAPGQVEAALGRAALGRHAFAPFAKCVGLRDRNRPLPRVTMSLPPSNATPRSSRPSSGRRDRRWWCRSASGRSCRSPRKAIV